MNPATLIEKRFFSSARTLGIRSLRAALAAGIAVASSLAPTARGDSTFLLEIDSEQSAITQNCLSGCGQGEPGRGPFFIEGQFELTVRDHDLGFGNVDLVDVSVETEALDPAFAFPEIDAALEGEELTGDADPCEWPGSGIEHGTCSSAGHFDQFAGTFDGSFLEITGIDYQTLHNKPSYSYTIVANVVPEPSSTGLGAMALFVLISLRRHRSEIPSP